MDRETVTRHMELAAANPAKLPTGSDAELSAFDRVLLATGLSLPAVKRRSDCDPWRAIIEADR